MDLHPQTTLAPSIRPWDRTRGPRLLALICIALLVAAAFVLAISPDVEGVRRVVPLTARTSLLLFLLTFTASAAARRWPNATTFWTVRHRRWIGLGFAFSHALHLVALIAFARLAPTLFHAVAMPTQFVTGGIAYLFIALMAATSSDRAVRWLGARRWRLLHLAGQWYLWVSFVVAFGKRVPGMGGYAVPVMLLMAGLVLRLATPRTEAGPRLVDRHA